MEEKLKSIIESFKSVEEKLNDPDLMRDMDKYRKVTKEHKDKKPLVDKAREYLSLLDNIRSNEELLNDSSAESELKELAEAENTELQDRLEAMEEELRFMLIPKDPDDEKNCIFEIRAGTGGDEAGIFVGNLYQMYEKYAEEHGYKIEIIDFNESDRGGYKEMIFSLIGEGAFGTAKYESGVHRVQRVPETETSGRLHTSAATVAVLPEAEDVDVEINDEDLRIDIFRAGGKGGQNVNKVETAVRIVHLPTNIVVNCQEERSQLKNKNKAMKVLRTRLYEMELERRQQERSSTRKSMVKSGDRSEKIRTYNFPQNRVTDHRLEGDAKNYNLEEVMEGNLDPIIENLKIAERTELMNQTAEGV